MENLKPEVRDQIQAAQQKLQGAAQPIISQPQKFLDKKEERRRMRMNLMFTKKENEVLLKYPGDLNGKQFKLEDNKN